MGSNFYNISPTKSESCNYQALQNPANSSKESAEKLCTLLDREGNSYEISLNLLHPWRLSLPFTSYNNANTTIYFDEATTNKLKLDLCPAALSTLIDFFKDWEIDKTNNKIEVWNKLQESILKGDLSDIIEQIVDIEDFANSYMLPELRAFVHNIVLNEISSSHINEQSIKELEKYIISVNEEKIDDLEKRIPLPRKIFDIRCYRFAWLALFNYHISNNNFKTIDFLIKDIEQIGIKEFTSWIKEILPPKFSILYLRAILSVENNQDDQRIDSAISVLKEYFPNYFHRSNFANDFSLMTYMFMEIAVKVQTSKQAEKLFNCISELSPLEKQNHLKLSDEEENAFIQCKFPEANYFKKISSILLTRSFEQIFHNLVKKDNFDEIKNLIENWHKNIKFFENTKNNVISELITNFFSFFFDNPNSLLKNFEDRINATYCYLKIVDFLQTILNLEKHEITKHPTIFNTSVPFDTEMTEADINPLLILLEELNRNENISLMLSLLFAIRNCRASDELKNQILNQYPDLVGMLPSPSPEPQNFEKILELWEENRCFESEKALRKLLNRQPLNRFKDLSGFVQAFCNKFGCHNALKFVFFLTEEEKNAWINEVCQYFSKENEIDSDFLEKLKTINNNLYVKILNRRILKISDPDTYINFLEAVIDYVTIECNISELTVTIFNELELSDLLMKGFQFDQDKVLHAIARSGAELYPHADSELQDKISTLIATIDLILKKEIRHDLISQMNPISVLTDIVEIAEPVSIEKYKNVLEYATSKLPQIYNPNDASTIEYIEDINNLLIGKCWKFFTNSSFESEREFLKAQLTLLKNYPASVECTEKLAYMRFLLTSDTEDIEMLQQNSLTSQSLLTPLGKIIGKQNDHKLLEKLKKCRSYFPNSLWGNLILANGYLMIQNKLNHDDLYALNCIPKLNMSAAESVILSLLHPLPDLQITQEIDDEREKERETYDEPNIHGKRQSKTDYDYSDQQKRRKVESDNENENERSSRKGKEKEKPKSSEGF